MKIKMIGIFNMLISILGFASKSLTASTFFFSIATYNGEIWKLFHNFIKILRIWNWIEIYYSKFYQNIDLKCYLNIRFWNAIKNLIKNIIKRFNGNSI